MSFVIINKTCGCPYCEVSRTGGQPEFLLQAELPLSLEKTLYIMISYEGLTLEESDKVFIRSCLEWARKTHGNMQCETIDDAVQQLSTMQYSRPDKKQVDAVIAAFETNQYTGFLVATSRPEVCERLKFYTTTPGICGALIKGTHTFKIND